MGTCRSTRITVPKSLSVNKTRDAFDPNAIGYAKDGEGRGRPHARAGRQSRRRIGVKPSGNGQIGPIALSLGLPWGATQGCPSLRALGPICRVRTRDLLTDNLLGRGLFAGCHGNCSEVTSNCRQCPACLSLQRTIRALPFAVVRRRPREPLRKRGERVHLAARCFQLRQGFFMLVAGHEFDLAILADPDTRLQASIFPQPMHCQALT